MGIYREWHKTPVGMNAACHVLTQRDLDRQHYAEVEAQHKSDIESMDNSVAYWNRQTDEARKRRDEWADKAIEITKERDKARAELVELRELAEQQVRFAQTDKEVFRNERDKAREYSERFQRRNHVQAETIGFLQRQNDSLRGQLNAAEQEIKIVRARPAQDESLRHAR